MRSRGKKLVPKYLFARSVYRTKSAAVVPTIEQAIETGRNSCLSSELRTQNLTELGLFIIKLHAIKPVNKAKDTMDKIIETGRT